MWRNVERVAAGEDRNLLTIAPRRSVTANQLLAAIVHFPSDLTIVKDRTCQGASGAFWSGTR